MVIPLRVPVRPQPPTGPPMGLLDAAIDPDPLDLDGKPIDNRWEAGFAWTTRQAATISGRNDCGTVATSVYRTGLSLTARKRTHQPVIIDVANDDTTTFGTDFDYQRQTAIEALIAAEPVAAEQELWEGTLARAAIAAGDDAYSGNLWLTKHGVATDLTGGTPVTPARAVGILEDFLGSMGFGSAGMIHMQPQLVTPLEPGLTKVQRKLYTAQGTLIVSGSGYTGTGPAGTDNVPATPTAGTVWAYCTGLVTYRHGEIVVTPDTDSQAVMRAANRRDITAQRSTAGTWDSPAVGAALVTLPS